MIIPFKIMRMFDGLFDQNRWYSVKYNNGIVVNTSD